MTVTTRWMVVERDAFEPVYGPPDGQVVGYAPVHDGRWPNDHWWREAERVVQTVDEEMCALRYITDDATGQMCANGIGWVLVGYEDTYGREVENVEFREFVLVEYGHPGSEPPVAVCLECGPEDLYLSAASGRKAYLDRVEETRRKAAAERAAR